MPNLDFESNRCLCLCGTIITLPLQATGVAVQPAGVGFSCVTTAISEPYEIFSLSSSKSLRDPTDPLQSRLKTLHEFDPPAKARSGCFKGIAP